LKTREKVTYNLDKIIVDAFRSICDIRKEKYSTVVEYLMKEFLIFIGEEDSKQLEFNRHLLKLVREKEVMGNE